MGWEKVLVLDASVLMPAGRLAGALASADHPPGPMHVFLVTNLQLQATTVTIINTCHPSTTAERNNNLPSQIKSAVTTATLVG